MGVGVGEGTMDDPGVVVVDLVRKRNISTVNFRDYTRRLISSFAYSYLAGGGRGGGRGRPRMDDRQKLRFSNTIKIDPELKTPVTEMNLSERTLRVLKEKGFETLTPVQSQSYSSVYSGVDVVARSRTGTGKTFAFGLPLIEKVVADGNDQLRSNDLPLILVLEPTRELCIQVAQELSSVCSAHRMRVQAIYGGTSFSMQGNSTIIIYACLHLNDNRICIFKNERCAVACI